MTFGKTISVFTTSRDRYGRVIGHVTAEGVDINAELVRLGYAWVYRRYSNDPALLCLEKSARAEKLGLWAESSPIPPWEWRRGRRPSSDSLAASPRGALSGL
jgi:micrococcal nuclease